MDAVLVGNADRMMLSAALREDGIGLTVAGRVRGSASLCRPPGGWGEFGDRRPGVAEPL